MVTDELSVTFAALADPIRRAILERLSTGEASVNELAEPFDVSLQAISRHIKVLERAGLISRGRDAQFRPCRLEDARLDVAIDWIEQHRKVWEDRMDQLEVHLRTVQQGTSASHVHDRAQMKRPRRNPRARRPEGVPDEEDPDRR